MVAGVDAVGARVCFDWRLDGRAEWRMVDTVGIWTCRRLDGVVVVAVRSGRRMYSAADVVWWE